MWLFRLNGPGLYGMCVCLCVREKSPLLSAPPSCAKPVPLPRTRTFPGSARGTIAINSVSRTRKRQRPRLYWDDGWNYWGVLPHTTHTSSQRCWRERPLLFPTGALSYLRRCVGRNSQIPVRHHPSLPSLVATFIDVRLWGEFRRICSTYLIGRAPCAGSIENGGESGTTAAESTSSVYQDSHFPLPALSPRCLDDTKVR
jgi:hypothetical protein